jgi:hypothetical protein
MRLLIVSAITSLLAAGIQAQSLSEHAAAAAGATIGTAAGKPLSNAITKIFGSVDNDAKKAAATKANTPKVQTKDSKESTPTPSMSTPTLGGSSTPSIGSTSPPPSAAPGSSRRQSRDAASASRDTTTVSLPVVSVPAVQEQARVEPTAEQLASVKVGATAKEVLAVLGPPESRVTIPDEGHMLEICQYWARGKQLGTVRLDNGQVVTVQSSAQN